jgi:hypothetical protein
VGKNCNGAAEFGLGGAGCEVENAGVEGTAAVGKGVPLCDYGVVVDVYVSSDVVVQGFVEGGAAEEVVEGVEVVAFIFCLKGQPNLSLYNSSRMDLPPKLSP